MKIYTKTGDKGTTSLLGGQRVAKYELRIEAYGSVDELNANLGLLRDHLSMLPEQQNQLISVQNALFAIGSHLATEGTPAFPLPELKETWSTQLEKAMDRMDESLPPLRNFVLPGGHSAVSVAHICRTVCRRAERRVAALGAESEIPDPVLPYLNRLSDYLFVLSRFAALTLKIEETPWNSGK